MRSTERHPLCRPRRASDRRGVKVIPTGLGWRRGTRWLEGLFGLAALLLVWHVLAVTVLSTSHLVPTPGDVLRQLTTDRASYLPNAATTLREATVGYVWGNAVAIVLALLFELAPVVEQPLLRLAIACFNIPLVAIAPILVVVLPGDGPKGALAALAVFFTTLIASLVGLRSADPTSLDVVRAYGGGPAAALWKVKVWAALPGLFAGLRIAAPAALLGALIGEYLGANQGLGAAMIQAQSSFQVTRTWGIALVVALLAGLFYLAASLLARILVPWMGQSDVGLAQLAPVRPSGGRWRRLGRSAGLLLLSVVVIVGAWSALVHGFRLNSFFAKDPIDVYNFLVTAPAAPEHRRALLDALKQTLSDAAAGYVVGTFAATAAAVVVVLSATLERTVMPVAITL
ncbi:MAG: ABC transporter permease subunit, partial [Chloroflexi bacterium]|nr:ABC transporter permease subunit [Chloroflexota bacterium]